MVRTVHTSESLEEDGVISSLYNLAFSWPISMSLGDITVSLSVNCSHAITQCSYTHFLSFSNFSFNVFTSSPKLVNNSLA